MSTDVATPNMSAATKDILARVQRMVPPMLERFHKGSWALSPQKHKYLVD
jgi:hypothetical protein